MSRRLFVSALVMLCLTTWPRFAFAQETVNNASVSGRVTDPSSAGVAGAQVVARHTETNVTATTATDREGRFRFPYLRVGPYEITVRQAGFAPATRALTLTVGGAFDLPVSLAVGTVEANVTVTTETTVLETARSQIAGTVAQSEIKSVPLNGRNFLDLALLIPGVSPTNVGGGTQLFPETSGVPGVGVSIGSQRNFSNSFIVDGLSANDDAAGLSGIAYGVDAVDQFQVVTSGGQAELGRALGGYINIVTKSGTNALHGETYDYQRDRRLNAPNALSGTTLPMSQTQYGGSLGGPILRDRTFYFANVEHRNLIQSGLVTIPADTTAAINARLAAVGYQGPLVTTGVYPNPVRTTNVLTKVDHQISDKDHLGMKFSLYDASSGNSRGAGAQSAPSASAGLDNIDETVSASNVVALSTNTVNETRAQFAYSNLNAPPTDAIGPAVAITGVATFGTLSGSPTARLNKMFEIVDNLTHQAGAHALRVGADVLYNADTITYPRAIRGSYTFSSLANFLAGVYNNSTGFTQTFGTTVVAQTNPNLGVYAQDEWHVGPALTVNAGVRYDLQYLQTIHTDTNNVSPRLGFAWQPFESRRTVIRGSAGVFYDRVPLRALANALLSAGNTTDLGGLRQISVSLSPTQTGAPVFPNILSAVVPSVTLVSFTTMDRNLQNASAQQASAELEQQVGARATLSVGYQHLKGSHLIIQVNQNVPTCVASGTNNGCRPNSAYANNNQYSSVGSSDYNALHVSWIQRPVGWGSYRVSYTYSKSMNNVGEAFFNQPIDPFDLSKDWGRSDDDQQHRFVFNGAVNTSTAPATTAWQRMTHGFQLSGLLQYYSALPFNITSGVTTVQGTPGRPIVNGAFIPRNSGVGNDFFSVSLRLSRTFAAGTRVRVEAMAEAFNVTNRSNPITRVTQFGAGAYPASPSATFGQITAVGDPRQIQLGVRVKF